MKRDWFEDILAVLSNLSLCFLKTKDYYNTQRAASLGLWYAERLRTGTDAREGARAKLLSRQGLARFHSEKESNEDALADVTEANKLEPGACPRYLVKQITAAAKADRAKDSFRGKFKTTPSTSASSPPATGTTADATTTASTTANTTAKVKAKAEAKAKAKATVTETATNTATPDNPTPTPTPVPASTPTPTATAVSTDSRFGGLSKLLKKMNWMTVLIKSFVIALVSIIFLEYNKPETVKPHVFLIPLLMVIGQEVSRRACACICKCM